MVQISPNPRKRRRFMGNEFYAKDARFWKGRVKTVDRLQDGLPINAQAQNQLRAGRRKVSKDAPQTVMVYVVRFTLKSDPTLFFLKIGITGSNPIKRFAADADRFDMETIEIVSKLARHEALTLESALHSLFSVHKFRPPAPLLSGGNSECFSYSDSLLQKMKDVVSSCRSSTGRTPPS